MTETALTSPGVALVHDFLVDLRGAERVFLEMCEIWPQAPIFTAVYDEEGTEGRFSGREVHSSFLQRLRPSARTFRALFPLYPAAIESFDLSEFDLIVSSSSAWAHGVLCNEDAVHVSYCHNPFRYAWSDHESTLAGRRNPFVRTFLRDAFRRWRQWDRTVAQRTDRYVANSGITQARIRQYFGRESNVVYPPVRTGRFSPGPVGDHYAIVSELMPHKHIDVAIAAFNRLQLPLVVVGDGPEARALKRSAGATIRFTGRVSDAEVAKILQSARAMICPATEEFGIASVESQAAGRPVIASKGGGALETVLDGITGRFWSGGPEELARAVLEFDDAAISPDACTRNASRFAISEFKTGLLTEVEDARAMGGRPASNRQPLPSTRFITRASGATSRRRPQTPRRSTLATRVEPMLPPEVDRRPEHRGVVAGA